MIVLPEWVTQLADVQVYRATRMVDVLGDCDELVVGARLADGPELTCVAAIDHSRLSYLRAADMLAGSMDSVLAALAGSADPDNSFVAMPLADARAWLEQGIAQPFFQLRDESRPGCEVMLRWLVAQLPEGGRRGRLRADEDWDATERGARRVLHHLKARRSCGDCGHKELLGELVDERHGGSVAVERIPGQRGPVRRAG